MRLIFVALVLGVAAAGGATSAGAREYSAYADERKPVISFLFSEDKNVEAFRDEFDLSEDQVAAALAATREETAKLEEEHAESEEIVEAAEEPRAVEEKVAASDYDEEVEAAVAATKSEIEALLPEGRRSDFGPWVDEQWGQEQARFRAESTARRSRGIRCYTVYASYYRSRTENGNNYEVALPHDRLKFDGGYRVRVRHDGRTAKVPVKEVGPWNTKDNYWAARKYRVRWRDLPRCKPEAEAAYFGNYNKGEDQYGREVLNPAGIDLTLRAAAAMGAAKKLKRKGIIRVSVGFPWVRG